VHVPFCATRCGYCDFNTYTPAELGGANPDGWLAAVRAELGLTAVRMGAPPTADTVFVGGGTPSVLGGARLAAVLDAVRDTFGLIHGAEVTTEGNPVSTSPELFDRLLAARLHAGVAGHAVDRAAGAGYAGSVQSPGRRPQGRVGRIRPPQPRPDLWHAGGERRRPVALGRRCDRRGRRPHLGRRAGRRGRHLAAPPGPARRDRRPDDDVLAHRYEFVDERLSVGGFDWYAESATRRTSSGTSRKTLHCKANRWHAM
jgi:hypothetical protein